MTDQPIYTGIKEVKATSMSRGDYNTYRGWECPADENPADEGYLVEYLDGGESNHPNHAGYISWSPKAVFEQAYFRTSYEADEFESMSVPELAAALKALRERLDQVGAIKTEIQKAYDFLSIDVLPERMDEEGIQTLKIKDVGRLQASSDIRCTVPAKNKQAVQDWLEEHGHGSMISATVNASTLKAFVKEMMKEGKEWPEELLTVHLYSRATVVKA